MRTKRPWVTILFVVSVAWLMMASSAWSSPALNRVIILTGCLQSVGEPVFWAVFLNRQTDPQLQAIPDQLVSVGNDIIDLSEADITNISVGDAGLIGYADTSRPRGRTNAMKFHKFGRSWPGNASRRGYPIRGLHMIQIDGEDATDVTAGVYGNNDDFEEQFDVFNNVLCQDGEP